MNKKYGIDKYKYSIELFGYYFVNDNINNCYLLIDNQKIKLCEKLILNQEQKNKNILEIKLIYWASWGEGLQK